MRYTCGKSATLPTNVLIESKYTAAATATPTGESTANKSPSTTPALRSAAPTPPARHAGRREHREPAPLHDRGPEVVRAHLPGQHVRDGGHDGTEHAGNRPDEQREQDGLLERAIG